MRKPQVRSFSKINKSSFVSFVLVGASATSLHYLIMLFLIYVLSLDSVISSAIGYLISSFYNYWANSKYSFGGQSHHRRNIPRFYFVASIGLILNQIVLITGSHLKLSLILSQISATALVLLWNYSVNAIWTFSKKSHTT